MTTFTDARIATALTAQLRLKSALRLIPTVALFAGLMIGSPAIFQDAGATGCQPASQVVSFNGGTSRNTTTVNPQANSGAATSTTNGGNDNMALAIDLDADDDQ